VNGFLLDTNCISELVRPKPDRRVVEWMEAAEEPRLYLSVLTLGEIRKGLAGLPQGKRRSQLETWMDVELRSRFAGRIIPIDLEIAHRWGLITAEAKQKGKALPVMDGLLAATAVHYSLTMVSRNASDFRHVAVPVLNPWEA
jgi:predicted nucleic acid-binding protein